MEFLKKILRDLYFLYDINTSYRNLFQTGGFQQEMKISCQISISHAWIFFKSYQNLNSYLVFLFCCEILNILQESCFFFHWKNDFLVESHSLKGIILLDGLGFCFKTKVVIAMVYHITYQNFQELAPQTGANVPLWHWHN